MTTTVYPCSRVAPFNKSVDCPSPYLVHRVDFSAQAEAAFGLLKVTYLKKPGSLQIEQIKNASLPRDAHLILRPAFDLEDPFGDRANREGRVSLTLKGWVVYKSNLRDLDQKSTARLFELLQRA